MGVAANDGEGLTFANGAQLDFFGAVPGRSEGSPKGIIGDPARIESDQFVGPRTSQGQSSLFVHRAAKARARSARTRGCRLDLDDSL
jgi:hypothetical protein